jgi:MFS family permease
MQLPPGTVYQIYAPKYVLLAIVLVDSAVCGGASNSIVVILGRAVQGIGSAGIIAGCMIIITETVPAREADVQFYAKVSVRSAPTSKIYKKSGKYNKA